jgi:flagellin
MGSEISLSKSVRSNLLSLQNTAQMMDRTQTRLATGNKVNSALDNPTNFFTASSLNARAGDMANLLDGMANGIKTLEAADNGLKAITKNLESMQSTLRQARQDKTFEMKSYTMPTGALSGELSFSGGAIDGAPVVISTSATTTALPAVVNQVASAAYATTPANVIGGTFQLNGVDIEIADGSTQAATMAKINEVSHLTGVTVAAGTGTPPATSMVFTDHSGKAINISSDSNAFLAQLGIQTGTGITGSNGNYVLAAAGSREYTPASEAADTLDKLIAKINSEDRLKGRVLASNDNGKLRLQNLSTSELDVTGLDESTGAYTGGTQTAEIGGNKVRASLADQFNELRDQLDKLSDDASFNGINLLRGDKLTITFNESGTSQIDIQRDGNNALNAAFLGLNDINKENLDLDTDIDKLLDTVKAALTTVRTQASTFGSNLSSVQNRQDFTKNMINTLETGASNLTLADSNEEAANLLALQTRQQLSSSALSMASQQDQSVLQLLR